MQRLKRYPHLRQWHESDREAVNHLEAFARSICHALTAEEDSTFVHRFIISLSTFVTRGSHHYDDHLDAQDFFASYGLDLLNLAVEVAEVSLHVGKARHLMKVYEMAAERSSLAAYRFTAAWLALNLHDYDQCIAICEHVEQPLVAIYTLHGQALVESFRAHEAIEVLEAAVKLGPSEILAWFQLAKAYDIAGKPDQAWRSLLNCQQIAPQNAEVSVFMAMVALRLSGDTRSQSLTAAWDSLWPHHQSLCSNLTFLTLMTDLSFALESPTRFFSLVHACDWAALATQPEFYKTLPRILRNLHDRSWYKEAATMLTQIPTYPETNREATA